MKRTEKTYTYSDILAYAEKLKKAEQIRTNEFINHNAAYAEERKKEQTIYNAGIDNLLFVLL